MADKQVETKVVQVRFDNSKFSKNINKTIKECEKFDKSLQFKGSKNNIRDIQKALDEIDLKDKNKELTKTEGNLQKLTVGFKDLLKIKLLSKAMDVVISKTNAMIKSMLGINNVVAGWQQYEAQMTNVGGILNQVQNKMKDDGSNYGLEDVAAAMERLRWYTDETSYSFTTLSNGIRQFVVAGVDLNKAAEAAMGVTNLAGSAKVFDEYKIQSAMDAVAKAMQTGYMDTMKWTSLTNTAGIVTEEFSQKLLEEAAAQGKLVKSAGGYYKTKKSGKLVTTENIRSTLSDKWLTSDILANVMDEYASASTAVEKFSGFMAEQTDENLAEINKMFEASGVQFKSFDEILTQMPNDVEDATELTAEETGRLLKNLGYAFDDVSYRAFKSAQETTSFSQSLTYVKKAISTQWANIFEKIFGDYDKSTELWSDISGKFYRIFVMPFENLTDIFDEWSKLTEGGAEDFRNMVRTIIDIVGRFKDAVSTGFRAVFGEIDASWLQKITLTLKSFFEKIAEGFKVLDNAAGQTKEGTLFKMVKALSKIFASFLKITGKINKTILKVLGKLLIALEPVLEIVADLLDMIADGLIWLINTVDELGILDYVVEGVAKALGWLANGIKRVVEWIKGKVDLEKVTKNLAKAFGYLKIALEWIIDKFKQAGTAIKNWWNENEIAQKTLDFFKTAIDKTKSAFSGFKKSADEASEGVDNLGESLENTSKVGEKYTNGKGWLIALKTAFVSIGQFFKDTFKTFAQFLQDKGILDALKKFFDALKSVFQPIINMIVGWWKDFSELAKEDPTAALQTIKKVIFTLLGIFLLLQITGIIKAGKDNLWSIYYAIKAFKKKMLAERWKALASAILILSAAVLVLTFAMEKIGEIPTDKAWKAMGIIGATFGAFAALLVLINAPIFKVGIRTGLATAVQLEAFAIGIALFMRALNKAIDIVKGNSQGDIWKAYGLIAAVSGLLVVIANSLFKKVKKEGLLKGEFVKGPGLIKLINLFLVVYGILKLTMWFISKINEFEPDKLKTAGKAAIAIVAGIVIIMGAISLLGKIASRKTGVEKITHQWIKVNIGSLALVALAAYYIISQTKDMTLPEIGHGALMLLAIFGAISIVLIALGVMDRIASGKNVGKVGVKITKALISISLSVLVCVAAFKMIDKNLTWGQVWRPALMILALYALIGGIAIALTAVSKATKLAIGKNGVETIGAKSPIGGVLIAISGIIIACVLAAKLFEKMNWDEFKEYMWKLGTLVAVIAIAAITIMIASRFANGKNIIIAMASIAITIIGIAYAISMIASLISADEAAFDKAAITVGIIAGVILVMVIVLAIIANAISKNEGASTALFAMALLMLSFGVAILAIAKALQMVSTLTDEQCKRAGITIGAIFALFGLVIILLGILLKAQAATLLGGMAIILAMAVALIAIAGALWIVGQMNLEQTVRAGVALVAMIGILIGAIIILGALGMAGGIGFIGAALLLAIATAALILAAALWIICDAINRTTDSIIKLMNEASPEKNNNLKELGKSLMVLAAGTLANGLANFAGAVLGLGQSLLEFTSAMVGIGTSLAKAVSTAIDAFSSWLGKKKVERETQALERRAAATKMYADALRDLAALNIDDITAKIKRVTDAIAEMVEDMVVLSTTDNVKAFGTFMENLYRLKDLLENMPNPVITPVLDLTEFDKGMNAIRNGDYGIRMGLYNNYAPVAAMPSMSEIRNSNTNSENTAIAEGKKNTAEAITINQQFMLNDAMSYSYEAQRATFNAIADNTNSTFGTK